MKANDRELLNYALENGMISLDIIQMQKEMNEKYRFLEMHPYEIWQSQSDGLWRTYLPDKKKGRKLLKKREKSAIENEVIAFYKQREESRYLKDVFYEWAKAKLSYGEILKQTYDRYETDFYRFFESSPLYTVKFEYIDEIMLEDFIKSTIHDMNLSAKGWANLRTLINGMFKFAKKKGYTDIVITHFMGELDLSKKAFRKVIKRDEDNVFTNTEIDRIVQRMKQAEPSIINIGILLAFQAGLRIGELAGLKYSDLCGKVLTVSRTEVRYKDNDGAYVFEVRNFTKGEDGIRAIVMTDDAIELMKQARKMNPFGEYLFMKDGHRVKAMAFTKKLYRICDQLGIKRRSAHKARKTYGTKLLRAGVSEKIIEKQMGHTDINTTRGYYYYNDQSIEAISSVLSDAINE